MQLKCDVYNIYVLTVGASILLVNMIILGEKYNTVYVCALHMFSVNLAWLVGFSLWIGKEFVTINCINILSYSDKIRIENHLVK